MMYSLTHTPREEDQMKGLIEVKLTDVNQLFNSMDPSPFHERDLDHEAEEFIVSWAREHHKHEDLKLLVHISNSTTDAVAAQKLISESIAHYFEYRSMITLHDLKRLMREGRVSLVIGLVFLAVCEIAASFFSSPDRSWQTVIHEGLQIIGWVAMWKPLDIYLYRWWPLLALRRLYRRLGNMPVEVSHLPESLSPPADPTFPDEGDFGFTALQGLDASQDR
jgi:hypothetical protein